MTDPHATLLVSHIPVWRDRAAVLADPLWARDLAANAAVLSRLVLVCPVRPGPAPGTAVPLPPGIEVHDTASAPLASLVSAIDVVEIAGNFAWEDAGPDRRALAAARRAGKPAILGISSNRARTEVMNAAGRPWPRRMHAALRAASITLSQRHLARRADGVRLVGEGLAPLVAGVGRPTLIETASWIARDDIRSPRPGPLRADPSGPLRLLMAARLERMKGMHVGLAAFRALIDAGCNATLDILGLGPEDAALRAQAAAEGIADRVRFLGQADYPGPFFARLRAADAVWLTNLNDEQPRLVFDAMSQGAVPLCPRGPAYDGLALPPALTYARGDAADLARATRALAGMDATDLAPLRAAMASLAADRTIEAMHAARLAWVRGLLAAR